MLVSQASSCKQGSQKVFKCQNSAKIFQGVPKCLWEVRHLQELTVAPCLSKVVRKEMEHPQLRKLEPQADQHTNSFPVVMTEQIWHSLSSIHSPNRFMWEGKKNKTHLVLQYFQYWQ